MPLVRGELLVFLDHDDVLAPGFYTEGLREAVRSLFSAGVEVVVPSRIIADDSLSRGAVDRVPLDGLPSRGWEGLPRAALRVRDHALLDGAPTPRGQSSSARRARRWRGIFRHKAAFCSPWVLFDNSFRFAVRRDHPGQITKNWDEAEVARVRLQENERLLAWHEARGTRGEVLDAIRGRVEGRPVRPRGEAVGAGGAEGPRREAPRPQEAPQGPRGVALLVRPHRRALPRPRRGGGGLRALGGGCPGGRLPPAVVPRPHVLDPRTDGKVAVSKLVMQQGPSRSKGLGGPPYFQLPVGIVLGARASLKNSILPAVTV